MLSRRDILLKFFFFQAEDGIRDLTVTGVQTCALPILRSPEPGPARGAPAPDALRAGAGTRATARSSPPSGGRARPGALPRHSGDRPGNSRDDVQNAAALAGR